MRVLETSLESRFGEAQPSDYARRLSRHNDLSGAFEDIFIMGKKVRDLVVDGLHPECQLVALEFILDFLVGTVSLGVAAVPDLVELFEDQRENLAHPPVSGEGYRAMLLSVEPFLM